MFGPVAAAKVLECAPQGDGTFHTCLDLGGTTACPDTVCSNLHEGDLVAYNTKSDSICTLADLHAEQREFPHCIADGIPVKGYFYWSLMDNFEWQKGYAMQFGLIAVNRETMERTAKPSLGVLGSYAEK